MLKFYYTHRSYGSFRWAAYAEVKVIGCTHTKKINVDFCSTKWGARRELRKCIRQHIASGHTDTHYEEMVQV